MKQRVKEKSMMSSWDEVDAALRRMGEIDIAISKIEGDMTLKINDIKQEAETKAEAIKKERKALEEAITEFCELRKEEFLKQRSRELTYGTIAYRVTTKIVIRAKKACVAAMEALGFNEYLRIIKEPDKDLMLNMDNATLARIGATRKIEDKLRIEPNIEKVKEAA